MPGGSNSGRPFREDPTSYSRTGIPCGNPQRYASRGVVRMAPDKTPYRDQRIEAPVEDIETEGDRQLQALLKKQLNTHVSLQEQLSQKKSFTEGTVYKPLPVTGELSLDSYRQVDEHARQVEELHQLGLNEDEIHLKLTTETGDNEAGPAKRPRLGADPSIRQARLASIEDKIAKKKETWSKPDTFTGAKYMSRHEMDLEAAITHDREKAKIMAILMSDQKTTKDFGDPNDPINHLDSIWEDALASKRAAGVKHKQQKVCEDCGKPIIGPWKQNATDYSEDCILCRRRHVLNCDIAGPLTREQMMQMQLLEGKSLVHDSGMNSKLPVDADTNQQTKNVHSTCSTRGHETEDKAEVWKKSPENEIGCQSHSEPSVPRQRQLEVKVEIIPEDVIQRYRLSLTQIRELPRFTNYSPGEPSKTLYLKNLSPKVEESDLVTLFHRYQLQEGPKIVYKLLTGRMRGQAFVTFDSVETASKALQLINGYDFKGKPIIILYGRKSKDS